MIDDLDVKIFADGADLDGILALAADKRIAGFTTNPTLMWKAGLTDYEEFAKRLLERITSAPDLLRGVRRRRRRDAPPGAEDRRVGRQRVRQDPGLHDRAASRWRRWCASCPRDGVKVNVTALFTTAQVELITAAVKDGAPSYISVFAGRIADAGHRPGADHGARGARSWSTRRGRS